MPLTVPVAADGGTLEVSYLTPEQEPRPRSVEGVGSVGSVELHLSVDGVELPENELFQWALGHGETFETPQGFRVSNLAPGLYRACLGASGSSEPTCRQGVLVPGGELRLAME